MAYVWLFTSIAAGVANLLFTKEAALIVGEVPEAPSEATSWFFRFMINPWNIASIIFVIPMVIGFTIAMSKLKLSYITPLQTAISIVLTVVFCWFLFQEDVTGPGWLGIVIISVGVFLVAMRRGSIESKL